MRVDRRRRAGQCAIPFGINRVAIVQVVAGAAVAGLHDPAVAPDAVAIALLR